MYSDCEFFFIDIYIPTISFHLLIVLFGFLVEAKRRRSAPKDARWSLDLIFDFCLYSCSTLDSAVDIFATLKFEKRIIKVNDRLFSELLLVVTRKKIVA